MYREPRFLPDPSRDDLFRYHRWLPLREPLAGSGTTAVYRSDALARINHLGERLRVNAARVLREAGLSSRVTGLGSLFGIHPGGPDGAECRRRLYLGLYNAGVLIDPRGVGSLSTALTDGDVALFLAALRRVAARCA
ncbi:MAG: hypothetical protein ACJ8DJ_14070 [Gemmatimonadales bacterium]